MAIAGKVAITPGYEWSVDVAYDKLVVVTFGNNVYLSTKPSTGIEPTNEEYWMLLIENVTAEDLAGLQTIIESILNGTTPVGNSLKLGGKGASEYNLGNLSISEKSLDTLGPDYSIPNVWTYIGMITPTEKFNEEGWLMGGGRFTIIGAYYDGYKNGVQTIIGSLGIKQRSINSGTWGKWKLIGSDLTNYLPLSAKPTGSYTGNGSTTVRSISTGGIGNWIAIYGADYMILVSVYGAIYHVQNSESVQALPKTKINFINGTLSIASDSEVINSNGRTYTYQVL